MPDFIPGRQLSQRYYEEVVQPILQHHFPRLRYSAGLLGPGSEVLGFDTEMSTDHDWAPRVTIYLARDDLTDLGPAIQMTMAEELPFTFYGYPTQLVSHINDPASQEMKAAEQRPINYHQVHTANLQEYVLSYTGIDLEQGPTLLDWLLVPEQQLVSLVAGAHFSDELGVLQELREQLSYYPYDLWLYLLSAQWQRIGQEEPFVGRSGVVGDEAGSALIAGRLVHDVMRLCFLMEKQYAPYAKWFGSAFARLNCATELQPFLENLLHSQSWQARQELFGQVFERVATVHNALKITAPIATALSPFYERPFLVMQASAVGDKVWDGIENETIRRLPRGVGKIDQVVQNTDVLSYPHRFRQLAALYE